MVGEQAELLTDYRRPDALRSPLFALHEGELAIAPQDQINAAIRASLAVLLNLKAAPAISLGNQVFKFAPVHCTQTIEA